MDGTHTDPSSRIMLVRHLGRCSGFLLPPTVAIQPSCFPRNVLAKEDILQYHVNDKAHNRCEKAPPDDFLYPRFRNRCN
ncbi:hypothetical protein KGP95_03850 [Burkholderia multivorans]|uniref:hypothetical protein n=1 Tax=Burkholderia cepacia complex TaxID=87882 RepID=UPI0012B9FEFE|nr:MULTISPECIES: hypothetical protein [Burkholderia cepacia complex]MCO8636478.1 hypothetical protein [Burkholderia multivorans]MCO8648536.1 hypothetical protein [Burkholderia multivorans]